MYDWAGAGVPPATLASHTVPVKVPADTHLIELPAYSPWKTVKDDSNACDPAPHGRYGLSSWLGPHPSLAVAVISGSEPANGCHLFLSVDPCLFVTLPFNK